MKTISLLTAALITLSFTQSRAQNTPMEEPDSIDQVTACAIPTSPRTIGVGITTATLVWNKVVGAVSYEATLKNAITGQLVGVYKPTIVRVQVTGLKANTNYEWTVKSVCSTNPRIVSGDSVEVYFYTEY